MEGLVYSEDDWFCAEVLFMVWKDRFTVRMTGLLCGEICLWCWRDWFTVRMTGLLCRKTDLWCKRTGLQ